MRPAGAPQPNTSVGGPVLGVARGRLKSARWPHRCNPSVTPGNYDEPCPEGEVDVFMTFHPKPDDAGYYVHLGRVRSDMLTRARGVLRKAVTTGMSQLGYVNLLHCMAPFAAPLSTGEKAAPSPEATA